MMNCKVSYNYTASAACTKGQLLTFDADSSTTAKICAKPAIAGDIIIGVALHDCNQGDGVTLGSLIDGQTFKILVTGSASAGDFLEIDSDGDVKAADGTGSPLPLCVMFAGSNGLIDCVVAANPIADVNIQGDINIDGDSEINFGDETLTAPSMSGEVGLNPGGVHLETVGGSSRAVWPVGSITFLSIKAKTTLYAGNTIAPTSLVSYKPVNFTVADDGAMSMSQINSGYTLTGSWKILVGGTNAADDGIILILAQRVE